MWRCGRGVEGAREAEGSTDLFVTCARCISLLPCHRFGALSTPQALPPPRPVLTRQDEVASGGIYVTISLKRSTYLNKAMSMMGIKKVMKAVGMEESSEAFATAVFSPMQLLANNSYDANRHGAWRVALCDHGGAATSNSIQFVIQSFSGWEESNGKPPAPLPPPPAVCYV